MMLPWYGVHSSSALMRHSCGYAQEEQQQRQPLVGIDAAPLAAGAAGGGAAAFLRRAGDRLRSVSLPDELAV